jgi:MoaA/NifB/PqqE/SkfB family radical SAM enzyme
MQAASAQRGHRIDALRAPLFVSWQLTRDCNLACLHCCTDSAPGRRMVDELDLAQTLSIVGQIISERIPYVMLCGGEPLVAPHFWTVAETLGRSGVLLKIETNAQLLDQPSVRRMARLPIRSVQVSLDADTQAIYQKQRPGASLQKVHDACAMIRDAGLPLEVTFAPTALNIHEAKAVIDRARNLGAFRFNTGALMRIGTAARLWNRLEPSALQYLALRGVLAGETSDSVAAMELCYQPFDLQEGMQRAVEEPPATLLLLPNGYVKVAAALPHICADLRRVTLAVAWHAYLLAWHTTSVRLAAERVIADQTQHPRANAWEILAAA